MKLFMGIMLAIALAVMAVCTFAVYFSHEMSSPGTINFTAEPTD